MFVCLKAWMKSKMNFVGSKTRSQGYSDPYLSVVCHQHFASEHSIGRIFGPIITKLDLNVNYRESLDEFESGSRGGQ